MRGSGLRRGPGWPTTNWIGTVTRKTYKDAKRQRQWPLTDKSGVGVEGTWM